MANICFGCSKHPLLLSVRMAGHTTETGSRRTSFGHHPLLTRRLLIPSRFSLHQTPAVVPGLAAFLILQHGAQQLDVPNGQSQDLVLAELLVGRVRGHEASQVGERAVHVLLTPAFAAVGEHPVDELATRDPASVDAAGRVEADAGAGFEGLAVAATGGSGSGRECPVSKGNTFFISYREAYS